MLEGKEFKEWIEASHVFFKIFEGRYDAYPLAKKWAQEWFSSKDFTVSEKDTEIVGSLIKDFDYYVFRDFRDRVERDDDKWKKLVNRADQQFKMLIGNNFKGGKYENVGFAVAPFLFTWNFQRFKEYFKRRGDFDLEKYFEELGNFFKSKRSELGFFREKNLVSESIENERIEGIFREINAKLGGLGIKMNEPIGTAKLLHILAPCYFPLIDNKIAKATGLLPYKGETLASNSYINWMNTLKDWLQNYGEVVEELQTRFNSSILKLIDEGLYMMSTVKLQSRVRALGLRVR